MNRRTFLTGALGAGFLAACGGASSSAAPVEQIGVTELAKRLETQPNLFLLDVRTPEEYSGDGHVAGSVLIPVQQLEQRLAEVPRDRPVACFCRSGNRSATACDILARNGYKTLANVQGGIGAWIQAGLPVER